MSDLGLFFDDNPAYQRHSATIPQRQQRRSNHDRMDGDEFIAAALAAEERSTQPSTSSAELRHRGRQEWSMPQSTPSVRKLPTRSAPKEASSLWSRRHARVAVLVFLVSLLCVHHMWRFWKRHWPPDSPES